MKTPFGTTAMIVAVLVATGVVGPPAHAAENPAAFLTTYCTGCHNARTKAGALALDALDLERIGAAPEIWEKVARKLRAGLMPPAGARRPDVAAYEQFRQWVQAELDRAAAARPDPGRTDTFHRLNRLEYRNAIRDLLGLDVDVASLLPPDDSGYGFDNIAGVLKISPSLMERYLSAAKSVSRISVGTALPAPDRKVYRASPDAEQINRGEGLPFGTRGGMLVRHQFVQDGEYDFTVDIDGGGPGSGTFDSDELEVTIDGSQIKLFSITPRTPRMNVRIPVKAGPRSVSFAFLKRPLDLIEDVREPFPNPTVYANGSPITPRGGTMPYVASVTVVGPYNPQGPGDTPSRQRIFSCRPAAAPVVDARGGARASQGTAAEAGCAKRILSTLGRQAFRGHLQAPDVAALLDFYAQGRADSGTFDGGIEFALRRLLVDPKFLFRVEQDPPSARNARTETPATASVYQLSNLDLASRLSFFLWSSIPDSELLDAAERGTLRTPAVLRRQVTRMLADPRSSSLTESFASQWLQLRSLDVVKPADPFSRAFDDTLRQGFRRETELFFESIVRENRSVMELLTANYTFLNDRLAEHYRIPNVQGPHFRRVEIPADNPRRGLLGQGSVLTLTSYATRTSPVIRGKFILNNILGTPPPDPPADVPAFPETMTQAKVQTVRERMAQHRRNPVCSTCHTMIDPAGFALENFDAIGRWRTVDESFNQIDSSGTLPDGTTFKGIADFRKALADHPERFVATVTEKLLTYALGRGLEYYDMPAVRKIVRDATADGYAFQSVILGVVNSYPFVARRSAPAAALSAAR